MRIEVATEGRMDMSGRGILRAIQNSDMPLLDLLVREAVQNSLDACSEESEFVKVDLGVGEFSSFDLAEELEGVTDSLNSKYQNDIQPYMYISDTGTEGLTGPLHYSEVKKSDDSYGNLLKLVYQIAKPQDVQGAGGSWGYGKTVYYRMGIGIVIYYSRILDEEGKYKSRLAACLVEDEKGPNKLLYDSDRGLAWWGEPFSLGDNGSETIPISDEDEIEDFLSIFGMNPYDGDETGTTVIIPYIDEEKLLTDNIKNDEQNVNIRWTSSVSEYLKIAIQRWYIGRLNNKVYSEKQRRPYLIAAVDGKMITTENIEKPFREIQKLYNMALSGNKKENYYCKAINTRGTLKKTEIGYVAYKMFSKEEMGMVEPDNNPSPFVYVRNEDCTDDYKYGDIIVTYFRKPGMAVSYDVSGEWVNGIKCDNENTGDILIAVFVLNSDNVLTDNESGEYGTVEEYFRTGEKADHAAWYDISVKDKNLRLLSKIQHGIANKINKTYKADIKLEERKNSSLSKLFGEMVLPPQGFGHRAVVDAKDAKSKGTLVQHKNVKVTVNSKKAHLNGNALFLPVSFHAVNAIEHVVFSLTIVADGKNIPLSQWINKVGIDAPFYILGVNIKDIKEQSKQICGGSSAGTNDTFVYRDGSCAITFERDAVGYVYGISFSSDYKDFTVDMVIIIKIEDMMTSLGYQLKEGD